MDELSTIVSIKKALEGTPFRIQNYALIHDEDAGLVRLSFTVGCLIEDLEGPKKPATKKSTLVPAPVEKAAPVETPQEVAREIPPQVQAHLTAMIGLDGGKTESIGLEDMGFLGDGYMSISDQMRLNQARQELVSTLAVITQKSLPEEPVKSDVVGIEGKTIVLDGQDMQNAFVLSAANAHEILTKTVTVTRPANGRDLVDPDVLARFFSERG